MLKIKLSLDSPRFCDLPVQKLCDTMGKSTRSNCVCVHAHTSATISWQRLPLPVQITTSSGVWWSFLIMAAEKRERDESQSAKRGLTSAERLKKKGSNECRWKISPACTDHSHPATLSTAALTNGTWGWAGSCLAALSAVLVPVWPHFDQCAQITHYINNVAGHLFELLFLSIVLRSCRVLLTDLVLDTPLTDPTHLIFHFHTCTHVCMFA